MHDDAARAALGLCSSCVPPDAGAAVSLSLSLSIIVAGTPETVSEFLFISGLRNSGEMPENPTFMSEGMECAIK